MKPSVKIGIRKVKQRSSRLERFNSKYHNFQNDVRVITNFNKVAPKSLKKHNEITARNIRKKISLSGPDERKEYEKIFNMFSNVMDNKSKDEEVKIMSKEVVTVMNKIVNNFMFSTRFELFIRQMSLVYLIASFENYLRDNLEITFDYKPEILKSNDKKLTYEEIFQYKKFDDIKTVIIERELEKIISQDIQNLGTYLRRYMKLDLTKNRDWKNFKELFYRRNIVIHNRNFPDDHYREKTGYSGDINGLFVDQDYVFLTIKILTKYSKLINKFFVKKFA